MSRRRSPPTGADLVAVVVEVAAALRAGADPAHAWGEVLGIPLAHGGSPTEAEVLAALRDGCGARDGPARSSRSLPLRGDRAASGDRTRSSWLRAVRFRTPPGDASLTRSIAVVVASTRLAHTLGAPLAVVLDRCAATLEAEHDTAADVEQAIAGPRQTAALLAWLPGVGLLLGVVLGADPAAVLLDGGWGSVAGAGGVLLTVVGRRWVHHLVRAARWAGGL